MYLTIKNPDKIIGREFGWFHWKIRVMDWSETGEEYRFRCTLSNRKLLETDDYVVRLCRKKLAMFSHHIDNRYSSVTPNIDMTPSVIRDIDMFVMQMAGRINLVI